VDERFPDPAFSLPISAQMQDFVHKDSDCAVG
jgi:hypothetical protein